MAWHGHLARDFLRHFMENRAFFTGKMPVPRLKTSISQLAHPVPFRHSHRKNESSDRRWTPIDSPKKRRAHTHYSNWRPFFQRPSHLTEFCFDTLHRRASAVAKRFGASAADTKSQIACWKNLKRGV
jgi:hypothetical protein